MKLRVHENNSTQRRMRMVVKGEEIGLMGVHAGVFLKFLPLQTWFH